MDADTVLELTNQGTLNTSKKNQGLIYAKTEGRCAYCGIWIPPFSRWHMDHMLPVSRGGPHTYGNVMPSCAHCNLSKSNMTVDEYRQALRDRVFATIATLDVTVNRMTFGRCQFAEINDFVHTINNHKIVFYFEGIDDNENQAHG